ncbi:hypothetical protein ACFLX2_00310 [Candidatus Dependentiae bacterium]
MDAKKPWVQLALITTLFFCSKASARSIKVKNGITNGMEKYKYLFMKIKPTKFALEVNGEPLKHEEEKSISLAGNKLNVQYDFEFQNGRKGRRVVDFIIPDSLKAITIKFNWKNKWRVLIKGAEPQSVKKIEL